MVITGHPNYPSNFEYLFDLSDYLKAPIFVAFSSNGQTLVIASLKKVILWDLKARQEICTLIRASGRLSIDCIAISGDGQTLVCGSGMGIIKVWDLQTRKHLRTFRAHSGWILALALSRDGQTLASGSVDDCTTRIWNLNKVREIGLLIESELCAMTLSPDGQTLACASVSNLKVWNLRTKYQTHTLEGHLGEINCVAISPDGKTLVSGSEDYTIKVWDLATGEEIYTLERHLGYVSAIAISPDGLFLVSGSSDGTIKIWNLAIGQELHTLVGHSGRISSVTVSLDGQTIVSGSDDGKIRVWSAL